MKNATLGLNYTLHVGKCWGVTKLMRKYQILLPTNFLDEGLHPSLENKLKILGYQPCIETALLDCTIPEGDCTAEGG